MENNHVVHTAHLCALMAKRHHDAEGNSLGVAQKGHHVPEKDPLGDVVSAHAQPMPDCSTPDY